jgi:peptidoglycan hydrolase-like protein with peptidoglycan-binding domain
MTGASDYLAGSSGIPAEVEPMVMSWCIYKGVGKTLSKLMTEHRDEKSDLHSSLTEINTALSAGSSALGNISSSVGKMSDLIDKTEEKIDAFYTAKADILDTSELWDGTNKRFQVIRDALNSADSLITNDASTNVSDTNIALNKISGLVEKSEDALGTSTEGDIKTALTNANDILAECGLINDKIDEEVDASKLLTSDVDSSMQKAITELDEAIADTDSDSDGNFATAITNMKTALAEYSTYQTGGSIDGVQGAIQNAQGLIDGNLPTSEFDAFNLIQEEELDVLQAVVQTAGAELQRAQSYIAEWQAASGVLGQEVQGFASEVQTRSAFVQAKSVVWQGAVAVAQGYLAEIQGKLNVAQGYGSQVQSKLAVVQGYSGEVQTRIAHSGAFGAVANITGNEGQMRLQQLTATTQTAAHELNRATIAVQEITTLVSVHGLDLQGVQQYIAAMQQWFQQSQGYLGEAQGYYGEVTARLALITSRLSEKQLNNALLSAAYQEMMACQERHYNEFNTALQMLQAGTYQVQAKDDIKKLPTYTGIAE